MRLRGGGKERKDRREKWIILLRQREVRAEPGMSMQTRRRMWLRHLLNYSVLKYCLDTQGDTGNIQGTFFWLQQQKTNNVDATHSFAVKKESQMQKKKRELCEINNWWKSLTEMLIFVNQLSFFVVQIQTPILDGLNIHNVQRLQKHNHTCQLYSLGNYKWTMLGWCRQTSSSQNENRISKK